MRRLSSLIVALAFFSSLGMPTRAQQAPPKPLTNADIVKMVKAGLGDSVTIAAIQQASQKSFDLSPEALVALKQAGVTEGILKAMLGTSAPAQAAPSDTPDPNNPLAGRAPGLYFDKGTGSGKPELVTLQATSITQMKSKGGFASAMSYGIAKSSMVAVVGGAQAKLRTTHPQPVFYFYFDTKAGNFGNAFGAWMASATSPDEFVLVEMQRDRKNDERDLEVGQFRTFSHSMGVQSKDRVDFKAEQMLPGVFRVTTTQRLSPGEFCFFYAQGAAALMGGVTGKLFDFGID